MKKRKKPKPTARKASPPADAAEATGNPTGPQSGDLPTATLRMWCSIAIVFHLVAITISLTAVVAPSETQRKAVSLLRFYLHPTHFTLDGRPLYLTYGDALEQPHRLQISTRSELTIDDDQWITVEPKGRPGLAINDRYARWLSTAAMLGDNEDPGLVAELLLPVVQQDDSIRAVRIVRLPTDLTGSLDDAARVPYEARVITSASQTSLVQLRPLRLSAIAAEGDNDDE